MKCLYTVSTLVAAVEQALQDRRVHKVRRVWWDLPVPREVLARLDLLERTVQQDRKGQQDLLARKASRATRASRVHKVPLVLPAPLAQKVRRG